MARSATKSRDTSIETYRAKRNFAVTAEPPPPPAPVPAGQQAPMFVVQKHHARRAGLHWDFRLEHGGVLWSWAVRKGPSLDPAHKRIAAHVEDHPIDYAEFQGNIPDGQYGAGSVETWDRGTWQPLGDPASGMQDGEIKFVLSGKRLNGKFTLVRLRPRPGERGRQDNWLLIKGHDAHERTGGDAEAIESDFPLAEDPPPPEPRTTAPIKGAKRASLPARQEPQLASVADDPPAEADWLSEIKFDGYRLLCWLQDGTARVVTRSGQDWTDRLPAVAGAVSGLRARSALVDGELVALDAQGYSSFPSLQSALANGRDGTLFLFLFDLLHLDGWDLRACPLRERKRLLHDLDPWTGMLRYSDHHEGDTAEMRRAACRMKLEGILCKRADAPYRAGRGTDWRKVKCQGREEMVVLGWTPPAGSRTGFGALHLGYYDQQGNLHYAGGAGSGFSDDELTTLSGRLKDLAAPPPKGLLLAGDPPDSTIHWVRPELVAEISYTAWSGAGRVRHAVYLGLREDKPATEVVRDAADPEAKRWVLRGARAKAPPGFGKDRPTIAIPPRRSVPRAKAARAGGAIVTARAPRDRSITIEGVTLTHPDRPLWLGITKRDLAEYWQNVAEHALPGIAHRPLAILRCPEGIKGEQFFQKHPHGELPPEIRAGEAGKAPYLAIDGLQGLIAMAQLSAIELHVWGAAEQAPLLPDQLVFDLDPGDDVPFTAVITAAHHVRERLSAIGLSSFCRTTGGKGLHLVVPLKPQADWDAVRPFCKAFAEMLSRAHPDRYVSTVRKADRRGRILIDWLRNGLGSTAVASFCPRARPGATVATPLSWDEVTDALDPGRLNLRSVLQRLSGQKVNPWQDFDASRVVLPTSGLEESRPARISRAPAGKARIVRAAPPKRR
ncbi:MAG: DNA ligase D [Acetobacteraceae bacterium]